MIHRKEEKKGRGDEEGGEIKRIKDSFSKSGITIPLKKVFDFSYF